MVPAEDLPEELRFEGLGQYVIAARPHLLASDGSQVIWQFPNGYGASVIRWMDDHRGPVIGSYGAEDGLFELAVLKFDGTTFGLTYDTPITSDVLGWLSPERVAAVLVKIKNLEKV